VGRRTSYNRPPSAPASRRPALPGLTSDADGRA